MNFFSWLRDGVRQSVLLGVSDAVEQLGTPNCNESLHPDVAGFLNLEGSDTKPKLTGGRKTTQGRKRLGKSLKDLDTVKD